MVSVSRMRARAIAEARLRGSARLAETARRPQPLAHVGPDRQHVRAAGGRLARDATSFDHARRPAGRASGRRSIMTIVLLLFGEIIPKTLAVAHNERWALRLAPPCSTSRGVLTPITTGFSSSTELDRAHVRRLALRIGPFVTEDDIRTLVNVGAEQNVLEEEERELIHSVIEFGDTIVREVMTPRPDMVAVAVDDSPRRALDLVIAEGYSKLPVFEEIDRQRHRRRPRSRTARRARQRLARDHAAAPTDAARGARSREQAASRSCCARCSAASFRWRSSSTNTAGRPASSRWRTCSKRSSARFATSTTRAKKNRFACLRRRSDRRSRHEYRRRQRRLGTTFRTKTSKRSADTRSASSDACRTKAKRSTPTRHAPARRPDPRPAYPGRAHFHQRQPQPPGGSEDLTQQRAYKTRGVVLRGRSSARPTASSRSSPRTRQARRRRKGRASRAKPFCRAPGVRQRVRPPDAPRPFARRDRFRGDRQLEMVPARGARALRGRVRRRRDRRRVLRTRSRATRRLRAAPARVRRDRRVAGTARAAPALFAALARHARPRAAADHVHTLRRAAGRRSGMARRRGRRDSRRRMPRALARPSRTGGARRAKPSRARASRESGSAAALRATPAAAAAAELLVAHHLGRRPKALAALGSLGSAP